VGHGRAERQAPEPTAGPIKVDTKGLTAKIKFESVLSGYLGELNGKYKLRVTELVFELGPATPASTTMRARGSARSRRAT
jgi:hypothetical protein